MPYDRKTRLISYVKDACDHTLSPEDIAKIVLLDDREEDAEEKAEIASRRLKPLFSVSRIDNGWLVTAEDDECKIYDEAVVHEGEYPNEAEAFLNLIWKMKDALCPDMGRYRLSVNLINKDEE